MTIEREILRQIFLWMHSRYRHAVSNLSGNPLKIHDSVSLHYTAFREVEIEKIFTGTDSFNSLNHKKFLIFEPVRVGSWMLPVLSFGYDFRRSHPEFWIRLALFLFEELDQNNELRAVGYRFESPEGEGIHHYYHAQLIRAFDKNNEQWRIPCPGWLPTKQPAFALDAHSPVTLVACILISLYGRGFISELQHSRFWNQFKPRVATLMASNPSFQPTYWAVTFLKSTKFYKTWESKTKFKQVMKNVENATNVEETTFKVYYSQKEGSRFVY